MRRVGLGNVRILPRQRELIAQALDANRLSYGPLSRQFEEEFSRLHRRRFGALVNSGTSGLIAALAVLRERHGWQDGDEVLIPSVTFVATCNAVLFNRLTPVFVDVDPRSYTLHPDLVEDRITARTRALIPVHTFGLPCDMDPLSAHARAYDLEMIEDACETVLVQYAGRPVGNFGTLAVYSFYVAHILVTGVGGMVLGDDPDLERAVRSFGFHGRDDRYLHIDVTATTPDDELADLIASRFSFVRQGLNCRLTELEAALGLGQISTLPDMVRVRQQNAAYLSAGLSDLEEHLQLPSCPQGAVHAFMNYPLVIRSTAVARDRVVEYLERVGIETRLMLPLVNQPVYRDLYGAQEDRFPVARWINANGFYVGCHQDLTKDDLDAMIGALHDAVQMDLKGARTGRQVFDLSRP